MQRDEERKDRRIIIRVHPLAPDFKAGGTIQLVESDRTARRNIDEGSNIRCGPVLCFVLSVLLFVC